MINSTTDSTCRFDADIVSYMYDELAAGERVAFESHLVDCTACTDDFAEIADARFSVFEWHKEEFVPLASPVISIPYVQAARAESKAGYFEGIRELFALSKWPVAAAALVVIALGAGLTAVLLLPGGEQHIATNMHVDDATPATASSSQDQPRTNVTLTVQPPELKSEAEPIQPVRRSIRPAKGEIAVRRLTPKREVIADRRGTEVDSNMRWPNATARRSDDLPVLNSYEDNDDRSLRLSDLIDDDGSKR